jgi:hypothetical protein
MKLTLLSCLLYPLATLTLQAEPASPAWGSISTPDTPALAFQRILTVDRHPADNRLSLPTPFPNIVRAWIDMADTPKPLFITWTFNKDASEILLALPEAASQSPTTVHILTAETSDRQPDGTVVLSALDCRVVGERAQLETHPGNHRIGFWAKGDDYVSWQIESYLTAGKYDVELVYSRAGKAGAEAAVIIDETTLPVKLNPTGSWYTYQVQSIGTITLADTPSHLIEVKSTLQIGAVMNLKALILHPRP